MADKGKFVVVETKVKGIREVFAVPDFWIVDEFVFYPPGKDIFRKVHSRASVNEHWPIFQCKILRNNIGKIICVIPKIVHRIECLKYIISRSFNFVDTYDETRTVVNMYEIYSDSEAAKSSKKLKEYHRKHPIIKLGLLKHLPDYNQEFHQQTQKTPVIQNESKRIHSASVPGTSL